MSHIKACCSIRSASQGIENSKLEKILTDLPKQALSDAVNRLVQQRRVHLLKVSSGFAVKYIPPDESTKCVLSV
jgi:hypothetical protein